MKRRTVRPARRDDIPAIVEVETSAFRLRERPGRRNAIRNLAESDWRNFLVLEEDGIVQAVAHIRPDRMQVGSAVLVKGDVGYVGVRRSEQGRGLGTALMRACVRYMEDTGMHLSRLGGLMFYYRRFGYEPFVRRFFRIPIEPLDSELKGRRWADIRALTPVEAARVRVYDPDRDAPAVYDLLQRFYRDRAAAAPIRPSPESMGLRAPGAPDRFRFVYDDGAVRGYIDGVAPVPGEDRVLREFAVDRDCPEAAGALMKRFILETAEDAPVAIVARIPADPVLLDGLIAADIGFELVEMHQGADGNMVRVIDLPGIFRTIAPELERRLDGLGFCPWQGVIHFVLPGHEAFLRISKGGVAAVDADVAADVVVRSSQAQFVKYLFGIAGFAEFADPAVPPPLRRLLAALFPRLPCVSGGWG